METIETSLNPVILFSGRDFVNKKLQTANCCASKQGQVVLESKEKGTDGFENLLADSVLMTNLTDSMWRFIPEGDLISGTQASIQFGIAGPVAGPHRMGVDIVGGLHYPTYTFSVPMDSSTAKAIQLADYLNSFYPEYPYVATPNGGSVILSGLNYFSDNGIVVEVSVVVGAFSTHGFYTLSGGISVYQGANAITNQQAQTILDKLNSLCKIPCGKIFSSN